MTGLQYENFVAEYLESCNYTSVEVTKGSGDYGVDITAYKSGHKYAIQCKYYTNAVGIDAVQQVVAGMAFYDCDRAMVITNSTFTTAAQNLAHTNHVLLIQGIEPTSQSSDLPPKSYIEKRNDTIKLYKEIQTRKRKERAKKVSKIWIPFSIFMSAGFCSVEADTLIEKILFIIFFNLPYLIVLYFCLFGLDKIIKFVSLYMPYIVKKLPDSVNGFRQSYENKTLKSSHITSLPHLLTIEEKTYNIDNIKDIEIFPPVFTPITINGKEYYLNNYFRLCAKYYRDAGYKENAKALRKKVAEIETDIELGSLIRRKAKFYIKPPNYGITQEEYEAAIKQAKEYNKMQ